MQLPATNLPAQAEPFPLYPVIHLQVKPPLVLVQFAREWQLSIFDEHSSISKAKFLNL